eukprot:1152872-Pelagomonas_calceolata.AAC.5
MPSPASSIWSVWWVKHVVNWVLMVMQHHVQVYRAKILRVYYKEMVLKDMEMDHQPPPKGERRNSGPSKPRCHACATI